MSDTQDPRDSGAGAGDRASEPRAGDLLSGRVPREELDPATIAQLAAWFGAPAAALEPDAGPRETAQQRERRERREHVADAADPGLLRQLESWTEVGESLARRLPAPPALHIEQPLNAFKPEVWKLRLFDVREREVPDDLSEALQERAPQAVLRDLHRPVLQWPKFLHPMDLGVDIGGMSGRQTLVELVRTPYQVRMARWPMASQQAYTAMADLRARLADPWDEIEIPEERRQVSSNVRSAEDMRWFGDVGYDPDL